MYCEMIHTPPAKTNTFTRVAARYTRRPRAPHQASAGRRGPPRSFVVSTECERILDAVADVISRTGYPVLCVDDVIDAAGVTPRTFHDHFDGTEDAFLAAFDAVVAQLVAKVREAFERAPSFAAGVRDCLAAFLSFVASEPSFAATCLVEAAAAGPAAVERRDAAMKTFAGLIRSGAKTIRGRRRPPDATAETIVGGVYEVLCCRVRQGQTAALPELLPGLAYAVMLPYLGEEVARAEAAIPPG